MTAHIGGVSPGTDEGPMTIRIPSPTITSASGASTAAFAGRIFWPRMTTAITDIQVTLMTPSAASISRILRADAAEPELESRADALAAASAEVLLERRELVDTCHDRYRAGGGRGRVAGTTHRSQCPRESRRRDTPEEQRQGGRCDEQSDATLHERRSNHVISRPQTAWRMPNVLNPDHIELFLMQRVVRLENNVDAEAALHFVKDGVEGVVNDWIDSHDHVLALVQVAQLHQLAPDLQ